MDLYITYETEKLRFFTDEKMNFIMTSQMLPGSVILENAGYEFDGFCDDEGRIHILIQNSDGGLCYIKHEKNVWKKYNIFTSREKKRCISNIHLTGSKKLLCAFYVMKHDEKLMLVKHIFSCDNPYITPEVIDLVDFRKDICLCCDHLGNTCVYYRNDASERCLLVYDENFNQINAEKQSNKENTYSLCVVNDGSKNVSLLCTMLKNHNCIVFESPSFGEKRVITFGIPKNTRLAMTAKENRISVFWQEGSIVMKSTSTNAGKDFSKPISMERKYFISRVREKGAKPGIYSSEYSVFEPLSNELSVQKEKPRSKGFISERRNEMSDTQLKDMDFSQFMHILSKIEAQNHKMEISLDKICASLEGLVQFKKDTDNPNYSFSTYKPSEESGNIGEKNEENIRLFESLSIDEALPENSGSPS